MTTATGTSGTQSLEMTPPHPTSPLNGAVVDGAAATFEWQAVPDAVEYGLQVAADRQFARDLLEVDAGGATSIALYDSLPPTRRPYFWRVRATTSSGETRWSPYGRFFAGNDAEVDAFRSAEEEQAQEQRRAAARRRAERESELDMLPFTERDDTILSAKTSKIIWLTLIASFMLVLASALLATVL